MSARDREFLDLGARLALRGGGYVEPNPMVGALVVREGRVIGWGHHRRYGGPHAEVEALADCRRRGEDPRGATVYVTLEPCCHYGKQPPCTDALIEAGVARVVAARRDPNPVSAGGAGVLERAGIGVEFCGESRLALAVSDPFVKRVTTGLPWVIAKWAQFEDGRMVTRPGEPRWISNEWARRRVHRLRGRVDAVVTGTGTVRADDPFLTVRQVRARRAPTRVVFDSLLTGMYLMGREPRALSIIAQTARSYPSLVFCDQGMMADRGFQRLVRTLERAGANVEAIPRWRPGRLDLRCGLEHLAEQRSVSTVLLEAGPTLLESMFAAQLVDEAVVHVAGEASGAPPNPAERAPSFLAFELCRVKRSGDTEERTYRRTQPPIANR